MKRWKEYLVIGLISIVLGVIIAFQIKLVQRSSSDINTYRRTSEMVNEIADLRSEKEVLEQELNDLRTKLREIEESYSADNVLIKRLSDELRTLELFAGLTEVEGPGLLVTVDNPPEELAQVEVDIIYDYEMILSMVNELHSAGAEAISINGERLVGTSEIRTAGSAINVNNVPLTLPYEIRAIGNPQTLEGALGQRFGIAFRLLDRGYYVDMLKQDLISLPAYTKRIQFDYAVPAEE